MREPAFTPGPWCVGAYDMTLIHPHWPEGGEHKNGYPFTIASTGKVKPWRSIEQQVADARLIAAAPALYEAVEALVECFIKRGPFDEPLGSSEQAPSINAGIAALSLALGESPNA